MHEHQLKVTLSGDELARLDELKPSGVSWPAFLRSLLREPPRGDDAATRTEALSILTALARDGRAAAAIAGDRRYYLGVSFAPLAASTRRPLLAVPDGGEGVIGHPPTLVGAILGADVAGERRGRASNARGGCGG